MSLIGAILISVCSYFFGALLADSEKERLCTLDALELLFSDMQRKISSLRTPLYLIFAEFENERLESLGFLPLLRSQRSLQPIWRDAVALLDADGDIKRELYIFGETLGKLPLDEQLSRIGYCKEIISLSRASLKKSLPEKQKSIKTVCLLIGLMTAIILL